MMLIWDPGEYPKRLSFWATSISTQVSADEFSCIFRALQFIPAPTSPWLVRKHFLLANRSMLLASQL